MKIRITGIASAAGALHSGTELAPNALRAAGLVEQLRGHRLHAEDEGDMALPSILPRHNVPPVRNWPAPRLVWDETGKAAAGWWQEDEFRLIIGGDCSIVVGTAQSLQERHGKRARLLVIDGHLDAIAPCGERCVGAAGMGLWFLAHDENRYFWHNEPFAASRMSVTGVQAPPENTGGIRVTPLDDLRRQGMRRTAEDLLQALPSDARVLLHFDVDVLHKGCMAAAYSPSDRGLDYDELHDLLVPLVADPRVIGLEITEFSGLRDLDGEQARRLVQAVARVLAEAHEKRE